MDSKLKTINTNIIKTIIKEFNYIDGITKSQDNIIIFFDYINKLKLQNREENGEVMTNINLVIDLFNKIELIDNNIFKKKLKWCDTSAGCGIFFIVLYSKLIKYHTKQTILEDLLYFCELDKINIDFINLIFNHNNKYKLNIYFGDTLKLNTKSYFNINKFDFIVHNPPYNSGAILTCSNKNNHNNSGKHKTIWFDFILFGLNHLKKNGYMLSITPNTFFKINRELHNEILNNKIFFMINYDNYKTNEIFNASIPITIYLLQKNNLINPQTNIINYFKFNEYKENLLIDVNKPLSPIFQNLFYKLFDFVKNNNCMFDIIKKQSIIIDNTPIIYNKNQDKLDKNKYYSIYTYTIKDGLILKECKKK